MSAPRASWVSSDEVNNARVPDPTDGAEGIKALDTPGATIRLKANSTYLIEDTANLPLSFDSDDLTIDLNGSVINVADGLIADNNGPAEFRFKGKDGTVMNGTFDGNVQNQGADDTYGIYFGAGATGWTLININSINGVGDAFGALRDDTQLIGCRARGFTEDGAEYAGGDVLIDSCILRGGIPLKISANSDRSGLRVANSVLEGIGTVAATISANSGYTMEDVHIKNTRITSDTSIGIRVVGGRTVRDVTAEDVRIHDCPTDGLKVANGVKENIKLLNSNVKGCDVGVRFESGNRHGMDNITFRNNASNDSSTPQLNPE